MYALNLVEKIADKCTNVKGYPMNINAGQNTIGGIVRYLHYYMDIHVVICN